MSTSLRTLVLNALRSGDAFQRDLTALAARAKTMSYPNYNNECAEIIGEVLSVEPYVSRKGEGILTFTKDSAADQRLARLRRLHPDFGGKSNRPEPLVRERKVKSVADATVATIIAAGLTRAEFQAVLAAIKAGVSFK